jgi:hypothetical protein
MCRVQEILLSDHLPSEGAYLYCFIYTHTHTVSVSLPPSCSLDINQGAVNCCVEKHVSVLSHNADLVENIHTYYGIYCICMSVCGHAVATAVRVVCEHFCRFLDVIWTLVSSISFLTDFNLLIVVCVLFFFFWCVLVVVCVCVCVYIYIYKQAGMSEVLEAHSTYLPGVQFKCSSSVAECASRCPFLSIFFLFSWVNFNVTSIFFPL